jgi:hypothetical protein
MCHRAQIVPVTYIIMYELDNPKLGLDDRELEGWQDMETDSGNDLDDSGDHDLLELEEEDFVGM